ncbi:MAG: glycine cleavage system protein GcvH [Peptococcaceae bacterium]
MAEVDKKQLEELTFAGDIFYHVEHTWVKVEGEEARIGISDYAQDQLGEIIFIELPAVGDEYKQGEVFGQAESAKTVSSLYMPISGKIIALNEELEDDPEIVNHSPYEKGWMIVVEPQNLKEAEQLLSKDGYVGMLKDDRQ